jgi:molybdate transport system substrate-binding protein
MAFGWALLLGAIAFSILLFVWVTHPNGGKPASTESLFVYCAAGVKAPVQAAARAFEKEHGVSVQLTYGPSQTLLANIALTQRGDLYIPADDSYLELARQMIGTTIPLAEMMAVLAFRGERTINSLRDLRGMTLAQADPELAAIAKLMREKLSDSDWQMLKAQTIVFKASVTEVANDVKLGSVQGGFIWDAMGPQYPELKLVHLPELNGVKGKIAVSVLNCSRQAALATRFAQFLATRDKGLREFEKNGFQIPAGERAGD